MGRGVGVATDQRPCSMTVISFVSQKGGGGHFTLVVSLGVAVWQAGQKVAILDAAPHGAAASWYESSEATSPFVGIKPRLVRPRVAHTLMAQTSSEEERSDKLFTVLRMEIMIISCMREENAVIVSSCVLNSEIKFFFPIIRGGINHGRCFMMRQHVVAFVWIIHWSREIMLSVVSIQIARQLFIQEHVRHRGHLWVPLDAFNK